ncbi:MAG: KpsF/GutQ family sugar-phosphate isomerase [Halobacteriovoraceae bacterium]|jgi:arabinose-5-phosphate isomerase|nr:KpsF/GutQ family sugar-phosphate isomerase [Halobacteriovoraceae bacterium]MBT5092834.1 KpsF/GutQ family sugar-phosphate isomerase [Halobacteriovoraceae bacterium]
MKHSEILKNVLLLEAESLTAAANRLSEDEVSKLVEIFNFLARAKGSLFCCGVGKSGHIAKKIASTFASLGLRSHFIHPNEALHGDLGNMGKNDAFLMISKSGSTDEVLKLIPYLPVEKKLRIGLLGDTSAALASECHVVLDCSVEREACINNLAPTTSSTLALAMGDALGVLWENMISLSKEKFAINHPAGLLGKSLLLKVKNFLTTKADCPQVNEQSTLKEIVLVMTEKNVGACAVLNSDGKLVGIIVEGDIRRSLTVSDNQGLDTVASDMMTKSPISINQDELALEALKKMEQKDRQVNLLVVNNSEGQFIGIIRLHDLLKEGFK